MMLPSSKISAALGFAAALALGQVGCLPNKKADIRQDSAVTPASYTGESNRDHGGKLIAPKRCGLSFASLSRPAKDPAINEILWQATDELVVPNSTLKTLQANGLRVGVITGSLPAEIEKILNPAPPGQKVDIVQIDLPNEDSTNVAVASSVEPITLLLNREGKTFGKDYQDAKGFLRITATHDGVGGVKLKIVPLIQHGPIKKGYAAAPNGPFQPQEFVMKDGQAEEPFRDISATVALLPGQVLAIGGRTEPGLSLGGFLFTQSQSEVKDDKVEQRVVLIWAQPTAAIAAAETPGRSFFRRATNDKKAAENPREAVQQIQSDLVKQAKSSGEAAGADAKPNASAKH